MKTDASYETSYQSTLPLTKQIIDQSDTLPDTELVQEAKSKATQHLKEAEKQRIETITEAQEKTTKRTLDQLSEPGASSWLGALPLRSQGLNLTKGEFQDALAIRYDLTIKNLPSKCPPVVRHSTSPMPLIVTLEVSSTPDTISSGILSLTC